MNENDRTKIVREAAEILRSRRPSFGMVASQLESTLQPPEPITDASLDAKRADLKDAADDVAETLPEKLTKTPDDRKLDERLSPLMAGLLLILAVAMFCLWWNK